MPGAPVLVRYADDFAVCCQSRQQAEQVKARLAEWLATPGSCLQRGQDPDRAPVRGVRLPGVQHPPLRSQAADQTEHGGHQAAPETARDRDAQPCAARTRGRSSPGSTRSSGVGPPTTGAWCPARSSPGWTPTCGSSPTSGPNTATRTSRRPGWSTATSASSTSSGTTGGCSATAPAATAARAYLLKFSWTNIVRHQMVNGTASPDDPALTDYWAARRRRIKPPLDSYTLRLLTGRTAAARSAGTPAHRRPATRLTPAMGELVAGGHPQGDPARLPRAPRTARTTRQPGR